MFLWIRIVAREKLQLSNIKQFPLIGYKSKARGFVLLPSGFVWVSACFAGEPFYRQELKAARDGSKQNRGCTNLSVKLKESADVYFIKSFRKFHQEENGIADESLWAYFIFNNKHFVTSFTAEVDES